jgi:hypothetical protein
MTFKTKEEMFGDGGSFGAAVPYSTSAPPGTGTGNRGIQVGEQLTAAISNRPHYALALNDEDLNDRLSPFEADGLDASYRLGLIDTAGGGRIVTIDGGAIEARTAMASLATSADPANAAFRATNIGDTVDGGGGYDFVGSAVSSSGHRIPWFGFMDRRAISFSGDTSISISQAGVLNAGNTDNPGGGVSTVGVVGPAKFKTGTDTNIMNRGDLVEVLTPSNYAGLYRVRGFSDGGGYDRLIIARLDGTTFPTFTANTACTFRIHRAQFATTKDGVEISPIYNYGLRFNVQDPEAGINTLETLMMLTEDGTTYDPFTRARIDSFGTFRNFSGGYIDGTGDYKQTNIDFGAPAFYASNYGSEGAGIGYVAKNTQIDGLKPYYGVMVQEGRHDNIVAGITTSNGYVVDIFTLSYANYRRGAPGALVEMTDNMNTQLGIFRIHSSSDDTEEATIILTHLDQSNVSFTPGQVRYFRYLEGTQIGHHATAGEGGGLTYYDVSELGHQAGDYGYASMTIANPACETGTMYPNFCLNLLNINDDQGYFIRGHNQNIGETFIVTAKGELATAASITSNLIKGYTVKGVNVRATSSLIGSTIGHDGAQSVEVPIPLSLGQFVFDNTDFTDPHFKLLSPVGYDQRWWLYEMGDVLPPTITFPLSGVLVPYNATITSFKCYVSASGTSLGDVEATLWTRSAAAASVAVITKTIGTTATHTQGSLAVIVGRTSEVFLTISNPNSFLSGKSWELSAMKISYNYTNLYI